MELEGHNQEWARKYLLLFEQNEKLLKDNEILLNQVNKLKILWIEQQNEQSEN